MSPAALVVVPRPESLSDRIRALQADLQALNGAQVRTMREVMLNAAAAASEVADNPSQPAGVRQIAKQIAADVGGLLQSLDGIIVKVSR